MTEEYKKLIEATIVGAVVDGRNGLTLMVPHYSFTLDFAKTNSHILRLRKMYYKGIEGEFKTLTSSEPLTNVSQFEANGCNYWGNWAGKAGFLNLDYYNMLHPQLNDVIKEIQVNPSGRRHVIELWNHENLSNLSLPCCWHGMTFSVIQGTLHMTWVQRSVDVMVGLPSDIYLAYKFMQLIADAANLKLGTCLFALSNVHIYAEHLPGAVEILHNRTEDDFDKPLKFKVKV